MTDDVIQNINKLIDEQVIRKENLPGLISFLSDKFRDEESLPPSKDLSLIIQNQVDQILQSSLQNQSLISSGFPNFDLQFGGFTEGEMVVIGGRPGMGKTMLLISLALNMGETYPICYYNYDLTEQNLLYRFISALSDLPVQNIIGLKRDQTVDKMLFQASEKIQLSKININSQISRNIEDISESILQEIAHRKTKIFMIDNLQSIKTKSFFKRRDAELGFIMSEFKELSHTKNVLIIMSSQLNRAVEYRGGSKRPGLADLRDSGNIEQEADKVILIHCPDYYGFTENENHINIRGIMILDMAKNRNGVLGECSLMRHPGNTRIIDTSDEKTFLRFVSRRLKDLDIEDPFF